MQKSGDLVELTTKDESIKGILMSQGSDFTVIKLENGYNIGIKTSKVKKISILKKSRKSKPIGKSPDMNKNLPSVSIIHIGGTIASKVDYETGGVIAQFTPEELISMIPEINKIASIRSNLLGNILSENMRFAHYNLIAQEIKKEVDKGAKGIVITHGTDTLHYTSAALSFMLDDIPVPVVLVGAQRSSDRGSSDAETNLLSAVSFAANADFSGVAICMHEKMDDESCVILPGLKTRKMHTSRRDAFKPVNASPIARVFIRSKKIEFISADHHKRNDRGIKVRLINEDLRIAMLFAHPNMDSTELTGFRGYDGIVILGTGLGNVPVAEIDKFTKEHENIKKEIKRLIAKGTIIVNAPQTIFGRIQMSVYSTGRETKECGVLGDLSDMTPETTFIKLAWLLSNYPKEEVKKMIGENLKGEISERIESRDYILAGK